MRNPNSQILELIAAIRSYDENTLLRAVRQGIDTNAYDSDGTTPLIHAAACGNAVAVDFLLNNGADPLGANLAATQSPFVMGILGRDAVITRRLLEAGRLAAQSRRREPRDSDALFLDRDTARLVRFVREGLDPNTSCRWLPGVTLLSWFLRRRDIFAVSTVIQSGCDVSQLIEGRQGWPWPPLHVAANEGLAEIVWLLLLDGADLNRLEQGWSALFLATTNPSSEIAELLLDAGAAVDVGLYKETPLMRASGHGYLDTVQLLVARGADLNRADSQGHTPLHYAAEGGHHAVVKFLLDTGADPSRLDASGYTAADAASNKFDPVFAQLYREWGMPDRYSPEPAEDNWEPSGDFDYFLSYRHGRFAQIAADLANQMKGHGQRTFIDQTELQIGESEMLPRSFLKARLAKAIRRSRLERWYSLKAI
jgi:ankyrin repeat protein